LDSQLFDFWRLTQKIGVDLARPDLWGPGEGDSTGLLAVVRGRLEGEIGAVIHFPNDLAACEENK